MIRLALLVLCACNQAFGVKDTRQIDARYFDAAVDAAWGCPALGTAPTLDPQLHQDIVQWCDEYSVAGDHAVAACHVSDGIAVYDGTPHQLLSPATGVPGSTGDDVFDQPRLSSDGGELYVRHFNYSTNVQEELRFTRASNGGWVAGSSPPFGHTINDNLTTMVAGPTGDHVFVLNSGAVEEWIDEPTGWRDAGAVAMAGVVPTLFTGMNPIDPLRALVLAIDRHTYYTDRLDTSSPFRPAVRLAGVPDYAFDAMMTPDCGRVYITGLDSIFYVQQP